MSAGKISGQGDFAALVYPLSSVLSAATISSHTGSVASYDWTFNPPIAGVSSPKSYTVQQGDSVDAEQYAYLLFSGFGYSINRKQEVTISGDWFSQTFTDGISMTSSPTNIALSPMTGAQFNVYLDASSAGLGTTQLSNVLKADFAGSNFFGQYWPLKSLERQLLVAPRIASQG